MDAFILETLRGRGWQRGGDIFWTQDDAENAARQLIKNRLAKQARVLRAEVELLPVSRIPDANGAQA